MRSSKQRHSFCCFQMHEYCHNVSVSAQKLFLERSCRGSVFATACTWDVLNCSVTMDVNIATCDFLIAVLNMRSAIAANDLLRETAKMAT